MARKSAKNEVTGVERFPPLYLEGSAYHEAGHAVMAVLLDVPILRVAIGAACEVPGMYAAVELDIGPPPAALPIYQAVLVCVASEPAEKLAPNYKQFATMHKIHRNLFRWSRGVRNDLRRAFDNLYPVYRLFGYSESSARKGLKLKYRDVARALFELPVNQAAVHRLAGELLSRQALSGVEARASILADGPLTDDGLLAKQFGRR